MRHELLGAASSGGSGADIEFIGQVHGIKYYSASTLTVQAHADTLAGDLLIFLTFTSPSGPSAYPSGWAQLTTAGSITRISYKIATSSTDTAYLSSNYYDLAYMMLTFRGVDTTSPIDAYATGTSSGTAFTAPGVTTTVDQAMVVVCAGFNKVAGTDVDNFSAWTASGLESITEAVDEHRSIYYVPSERGDYEGVAAAYGKKLSAGSTGSITATGDASGIYAEVLTVALTPAA